MQPGNRPVCLDVGLFRSIVTQGEAFGLSGVKLSGGEPLIHPQIHEILDFVQARKLALVVETNGVCCSPEIARAIKSCNSAFVSVSLDGADPQTYEWVRRVEGSFEKAVQGIRNLVAAGIAPQIIMSVLRINKDQIEDVVRLAEALGAGSVKFNVVQPTARGARMCQSDEALSIEEHIKLGRWVEGELSQSTEIPLFYHYPPAFRSLKRMFFQKGSDCGVCGVIHILGVLADGSYALCGIGEVLPEMVFGHAAHNSLASVWSENLVLRRLREGLPERLEGICSDCLMNRICLGYCVAQNYYLYRDLFAPYWFCKEAQERGLFPKSRLREYRDKY